MSDATQWLPALFKGQTVLVLCDESGAVLLEGGRVPMKYRARDDRVYLASLANVTDPGGQAMTKSARPAPPRGAAATAPKAAPDPRPRRSTPRPRRAGEVRIYTDGACSGNPGAAAIGVVVDAGEASSEIGEFLTDDGTNNLAELTAILRGLEVAPDPQRPTVLYTDSQYAIGVLLKGWKAKVHIPLIARIKKQMQQFRDLDVRYVPGHSGIEGNERADALAREAIEERRR